MISKYMYFPQVNINAMPLHVRIIELFKFYIFNIDWLKEIRNKSVLETFGGFKDSLEETIRGDKN